MPPASPREHWWKDRDRPLQRIVKNISAEYLAIAVNVGLGMLMLPFNVAHLGASTYGLWILATSVTTYFSVLDLGYGSAQVKFAAQYKARRDTQGLNEIISTIFFLFLAVAVVTYGLAVALAFNLDRLFSLTPEQALTGRQVLMIVGLAVALGFPFSVFGGLVNGFQRYYRNNMIAIATSVAQAVANVAVLLAGYGLIPLVAVTTGVRLLSYLAYCHSAYHAFPLLSVRWKHVRRARLKEVTAFSAYLLIIDLAAKINFTSNTMVIGAFMTTAAIAVWMVAYRLTDVTRMLTGVLTHSLFPIVVDHATRNRLDRLRELLLEGTRLSLATVIPLASVTAVLGHSIVMAWVGPRFSESVPVLYVLAAVVVMRTAHMPARTLLKGTGQHRMLSAWSLIGALTNLVLSILLVRRLGLVGVSLGTLIPMTAINLFVVFPAACRRVELPIGRAVRYAVWPTVWPALLPCALLVAFRSAIGTSPVLIGGSAVLAGLTYAALFLGVAIRRSERRWYLDKIRGLMRQSEMALPA
jgi:O-antigen/teichoic acid export membrane protein